MSGRRLMDAHADWLVPEWDAQGVRAFMTTRTGGASAAPFDGFNLRAGLGDDPVAVAANQAELARVLGAVPAGLNQVHGAQVVRLTSGDSMPGAAVHTADACVTNEPGVPCAVQTADCLPVLFAAPGGRAIGAAHAGWRGLAGGVLESTLKAICELAACEPADVQVWLGACIGPLKFEVGAEVLQAFEPDMPTRGRPSAGRFVALGNEKWLADLPGLARDRLLAGGVRRVSGGTWCTVTDVSKFFSFRRDGITGRMAAVIWIDR